MYQIATWNTLPGVVNFKKQNYVNSCFSAAYQNLCANLSTQGRNLFSGTYYDIENEEYNYMLAKKTCDIDDRSPWLDDVYDFFREYLNPLGYSHNTIHNSDSITMDTLYDFGQTPNYRTGYILNYGDTGGYHAYALFIKRINEEDRYVFLNSCSSYTPKDFPDYAQSCNRGKDALSDLGLYDEQIHGGVMAIF